MQEIISPFVIRRLSAVLNSIAAGDGGVTSPEASNPNLPVLFHFINGAGSSTSRQLHVNPEQYRTSMLSSAVLV